MAWSTLDERTFATPQACDRPARWCGGVGTVRVRVVGCYVPRLCCRSVEGGRKVARRWSTLQALPAQVFSVCINAYAPTTTVCGLCREAYVIVRDSWGKCPHCCVPVAPELTELTGHNFCHLRCCATTVTSSNSREIGLLPIFLFSDVRPHGGGTALLRGSHKSVAKILWERSGRTGIEGVVSPSPSVCHT